jgi:hypothetical protein
VYGGGYLWVDALAPLSAWEGIPIRVDAHTPVGLELANHCRQPKTFKLWEKTHRMSAWRGLGFPWDRPHNTYRYRPRAALLAVTCQWCDLGPTSPPFTNNISYNLLSFLGKVKLNGCQSANNTRPVRDTAGGRLHCSYRQRK